MIDPIFESIPGTNVNLNRPSDRIRSHPALDSRSFHVDPDGSTPNIRANVDVRALANYPETQPPARRPEVDSRSFVFAAQVQPPVQLVKRQPVG